MTRPTIDAFELRRRRVESDAEIRSDALVPVTAYAEFPLRHPGLFTDAEILDRIRADAWGAECEIRDRQATRRELHAMARGELTP